MSQEHVIVLHGLWMRSVAMLLLARRLRAAGFRVSTLDYLTVAGSWQASTEHLVKRWQRLGPGKVHVVGHSLGGVLAVNAAQQFGKLPGGRIVCLGSPLNGSAVADRMRELPGARWLLGKSADVLHQGLPAWTGERQIGVVAGRKPVGLGKVLGRIQGAHDGTVAVEETRLAGIHAHRIVDSTHTGLVFSREVATLAANYLRHGEFVPAESD